MKIMIDGDACPVVTQAVDIAREFKAPAEIYCDFNHEIESDYAKVIVVQQMKNSADRKILNNLNKGDIVITNDKWLSELATAMGGTVITFAGAVCRYVVDFTGFRNLRPTSKKPFDKQLRYTIEKNQRRYKQ